MSPRLRLVLITFFVAGSAFYGSPGRAYEDIKDCLSELYRADEITGNYLPRKEELCSCALAEQGNLGGELAGKVCYDRVIGDTRRRERRRREEEMRRREDEFEEEFTERMIERSWDLHDKQMEQIQRNWNWKW